jgi:hypothetical protein
MDRKCARCNKPIDWPYFHCDPCVLALLSEGMRERAKEYLARSEASMSVLALTREDREFLSEMKVGCE